MWRQESLGRTTEKQVPEKSVAHGSSEGIHSIHSGRRLQAAGGPGVDTRLLGECGVGSRSNTKHRERRRGEAIMKMFAMVFVSAGLWLGACPFGVASDAALKTAKQAAAEFGLTDSDLTLVPPELYDCIRHYANTGTKYAKDPAGDGEVAELKNKLTGMRRASTGRFAASYIYATHLRYVLLRDASGMYDTVKFGCLWTVIAATTKKDVSVNTEVISSYARQLQSPGDFDRSFLSRADDGKVYLHEEMCTFDGEGAEPRLYAEKFLLEEVDGTWEGYLRGDVTVFRLGQAEAERRQRAQAKFSESEKKGSEDADAGADIEALRAAAEIPPEAKPKIERSSKELGCGPALLYIKRDAMLWIDSTRSIRFASVSDKR